MKAFNLFRVFALLLVLGMTVPAFAGPGTTEEPTKKEAARAEQLMQRLQEIKNLSKQSLSQTEKKELRKEVKSIRQELKAANNGIYLSVGAIIIIILLLILLL